MKYLFSDKGFKIDFWIFIDGGNFGWVNYKGLGLYCFGVFFRGLGGYFWGVFGLVNFYYVLGVGINYFVKSVSEYVSIGFCISYNVGCIGGGIFVNFIFFVFWMEVDICFIDFSCLIDMDKILKDVMEKVLSE